MIPQQLNLNIAGILTFGAFAALVLNALLGPLAALVFLACGGLLIISNVPQTIDSVTRWWPLLLLPAYCMLTALWSQYPANSLRYGLQLLFTLLVAVVMTGRVSTRSLMRTMFVVYGVGVLLSVAMNRTGTGGVWLGIFGSKNAFAAHLAVFILIGVAVAVDHWSPLWMRFLAGSGVALSAPLLLLAQSAGAIMMVVPCVILMLLVLLSARLSGAQKVFVVTVSVFALLAGALVLTVAGDVLLAELLEGSGKDPTMTGRTDLWAMGLSYIAERPLQGLGYRAFWVSGFAPAEELWAMFDVPSGAGFNFHNTYISNAVEIGLIGLLLQIIIIYGGGLTMAAYTVIRPNAANALLLGLQMLMILRSFIEVEVFFEFSIRSIMGVATFIYAAAGLAAVARSAPETATDRKPGPARGLHHVRNPRRPRPYPHAHL